PPSVIVAPVVAQAVAPSTEFVGRVESIQTFDARARVEGYLQDVAFQEGADVKAGDLLFVIEPARYQSDLDAARARQAGAEAAAQQAARSFTRTQQLTSRGTATEAALDDATAARDRANADLQAAEAAVKSAELTLSYTRVVSPIAGRLGVVSATRGNLVGPNSGVLATVVQLEPIRVVFSVSERDIVTVRQRYRATSLQELADRYVPTLKLSNGTDYPHPGRITVIDNRVDPNTGTVAVRAEFPNPEYLLLPGQFVSVVVRPGETQRRPEVPVTAVQRDREGPYVLVVDQQNRVAQRRIETGSQIEQAFVVNSGLQEGVTVIVQEVQS